MSVPRAPNYRRHLNSNVPAFLQKTKALILGRAIKHNGFLDKKRCSFSEAGKSPDTNQSIPMVFRPGSSPSSILIIPSGRLVEISPDRNHGGRNHEDQRAIDRYNVHAEATPSFGIDAARDFL